MTDFILVTTTFPERSKAEEAARALVSEGLAGCIQILPGIRSCYRWEGKVEQDEELLLFIKTRRSLFERLAERLRALHPYTVPQIIAIPILEGSRPYLDWLAEVTES